MIGGVPPSDPVPFVARQDQLDRFAAAVERAREGEPGILLVGGDAGVGKTRMLSQAARAAESAGARVVVAHCVDLGEVGIPYLPFAEAVDQLARSSDAVRAVVSDRPALARALGGTPPTTSTGDAGERGQVLEGFAAARPRHRSWSSWRTSTGPTRPAGTS
jgi:predicted ATPase